MPTRSATPFVIANLQGHAVVLAALLLRRDFGYALVIVWALSGIYSNRIANIGTDDGLVEIAAVVGMVLLGLGVVFRVVKRG